MKIINAGLFSVAILCIGLTGLKAQTVKDIDGNVYRIVTLGTQVWMAENLKTTRYNDGTAIPLITANSSWAALTSAAFCWYNKDSVANKNIYGALYNWYAVSTNKLCPGGWHVSTDEEWTTLSSWVGGKNVAGGKLKSTSRWESPHLGATNEDDFTALPGGYRYTNGAFANIGYYGFWWSATDVSAADAWARYMGYTSSEVVRDKFSKQYGWSVRCVKN